MQLCRCVAVAVSMVVAAAAGTAAAQTYPSKQIRFILPFPPGGPTDILGRVVGQKLTEQMGQPVVQDNRPGAGGNIGIELLAKSPPDGYTMLLTSPSIAISPSLYKKLNYDPQKDVTPVSLVAQIPNILLVHPTVPAKTLKEFIQIARNSPGKLNFGSGGAGTTNHLASEILKGLAGLKITHVPYKGSNQAMMGLLGGEVDMVVIAVPPAIAQIQAGKVRALAVLSDKRVPALPQIPTSKEAGVANFEVPVWYGMLMPPGTPREIVLRMNSELQKALGNADVKDKLAQAGVQPWTSTPEEFAKYIRSETVRYAKVIKDAGISVD